MSLGASGKAAALARPAARGLGWPLPAALADARRRRAALLASLVVVGLVLRVWVLVASARLSADEAVPGLMARHILADGEWPVFYWGQAYFGAAEAYLIAGLLLIFGFHASLVFVPALLASLALVPLTWMLAEQLGPWPAGLLASLPLVIPTPIQSHMLGNAGGGFSLGAALELAALVCLLRARTAAESARTGWVVGFALLAGLAGWVWQPALLALAPLVVGAVLICPGRRRWLLALIGVGLAPPLMYNAATGWPTLGAIATKFGEQQLVSSDAVGPLLLTAFGGGEESLGDPNSLESLLVSAACVVYPLLVGACALRGGSRVWRTRAVSTGVVLLWAGLNVLAAHAGAHYLEPVTPAAYALTGALLATVAVDGRAGRVLAAAVAAVAVAIPNLAAHTDVSAALAAEQVSRIEATRSAIAALDARGLSRGYADYWSAYPITYLSAERIIVAPALPLGWGPSADRYPAYTRQVAAVDADRLFVLSEPACVAPYLAALDATGATYRVEPVARWLLVWDLRPPVGAEAASLAALNQAIVATRTCDAQDT